MLNIEYVRSLNCNYERILLDHMPEENRYQYSILGRCQIRGLLPCSLRYIDGRAYLYYDISSRQNMALLYGNRCITREWVKDFMWSMKRVQQELGRFLLDMGNVLWYPEHIFQELEKNVFSFLYVPYYNGESGFMKLMEFWVEHIDYNDEGLVDCVYRMYERLERNGEIYLHAQIFEDAECLEKTKMPELVCTVLEETVVEDVKEDISVAVPVAETGTDKPQIEENRPKPAKGESGDTGGEEEPGAEGERGLQAVNAADHDRLCGCGKSPLRRTLRADGIHRRQAGTAAAAPQAAHAGGEIACKPGPAKPVHRKEKEEVDLVLKDASVSRIHARIITEEGNAYLEDLNSTNGTFQNGLRMQPYEKRKLEEGDEIKFGKVVFIFR